MKRVLIVILTCVFLISCSSDHDEIFIDTELNTELIPVDFPVMASDSVLCKDTTANKYEDVYSRAWEVLSLPKVYLISNYNSRVKRSVLEVPVFGEGTERKISFCLLIRKGQIYATYKGEEIPLTGECILSSVAERKVKTETSNTLTTPNGKKVDEPFGDRLFRTDPFTFSHTANRFGDSHGDHEEIVFYIDYNSSKYSNKTGRFQTSDWRATPLVFDMNRYTSKIRANLIITDYTLGFISALDRVKFDIVTGTSMGNWSFLPFITQVADTYDTVDEKASGSAIFPLLPTPQIFSEGNKSWFTGGIYYEGIGKRFYDEEGYAYLFPQLSEKSKLCYSFYYSFGEKERSIYRSSNTLVIKLDNIDLDPNVENEITTIFHINDLIEAMKKNTKSRAEMVSYEDADFGMVMEIPHEVYVTYK